MNHRCTFMRGFSLIELLLVASLTIVISTFVGASLGAFNNIQQINNTAYEIATVLQTAKSRAQSQVKPASVVACTSNPLVGYAVRFCSITGSGCSAGIANSYELHVVCGGVSTSIQSKNIPSGLTFMNTTVPSLFFQVINGYAQNGSVRLQGFGRQKTIQVTGVGNISIL